MTLKGTKHSLEQNQTSILTRLGGEEGTSERVFSEEFFKPAVHEEWRRVFDVVDSAQEIISQDDWNPFPYRYDRNEYPEPTPIGPEGIQNLVKEVPITDINWSLSNPLANEFHSMMKPILDSIIDSTASLPGDIQPMPKRQKVSHQCNRITERSHIESLPGFLNNSDTISSSHMTKNTSVHGLVSSAENMKASFRKEHSDQWNFRFQELIAFKKLNGHCLVPHNNPSNPKLWQWVKRQRYQYKLKMLSRHSTLSGERQQALEDMGFVWDSHKAAWNERLEDLKEFMAKNGHCNVPSNHPDRVLAIWVKCQRRQYKLYTQGETSTMNEERFLELDSMGFDWNPRNLP